MPFIPNEADAAFADQAEPDSGDFDVLRDGSKASGVVSGCAVTAQGSPDMTVAVAAGVIAVAGAKVNVGAGNVTITTAHGTNPRIDLVVVSSAGAKSVTAGTAAAQPVFPAIPANSVVLASVYVPATDTTIAANQVTDKRVFVIPPEPTTNYDLAKARSIPLVKERSQLVTLDTGQSLLHTLLLAKGKLFATTQTSPTWFIRCNNLEDLTDRTSFQFANDGFHNSSDAATYVAETDRIYVLFDHASRITVAEVNPDTHATSDVISDTAHGGAGINGSICSDGTHLYVATLTSPAKVVKYTLAGAFVAELTLTKNNAHAIMYDGVDLFVTGATSPGWIARVNPSAMTAVEADFPTGMNVATDDMASVGNDVWVGYEVTNSSNILRISKTTLAITPVAHSVGQPFNLHFDGRYVWVASIEVYCIDPYTLDSTSFGAQGMSSPNEIVSDGTGRVFVSSYIDNPSKLARLSTPTVVSKRIGIPQFPIGGGINSVLPMGKLFIDHTVLATTGSAEASLSTANLSPNLLNTDGMVVRVTAAGVFAANTNPKRIALRLTDFVTPFYMGDTGLLVFNDARWRLVVEIIRTGAATQDWVSTFFSDDAVMATDVQLDDNGTIDLTTGFPQINLRGQGTASGDVSCELMMVEVLS